MKLDYKNKRENHFSSPTPHHHIPPPPLELFRIFAVSKGSSSFRDEPDSIPIMMEAICKRVFVSIIFWLWNQKQLLCIFCYHSVCNCWTATWAKRSAKCEEFLMSLYWIAVFLYKWASLVAQTVKNLPAMQETQHRSLAQEDLLEERMATHSSILAWTKEPGRLQFMGSQSQTQLSN